tara:strand:- start:431 stop:742 length:312 start_codon:yes stop_codon:yes gene_type:complete
MDFTSKSDSAWFGRLSPSRGGNSWRSGRRRAQDVWFENWQAGLDLTETSRHLPKYDTTLSLLWFKEEDLPEVEVNRFGVKLVDDGGLAELTGELPWPSGKKRR